MEDKVSRKNSKRSWVTKVKSAKLKVQSFIIFEHIILSLILLFAGFMRLFRIGDYMTFLGDEGRDALVSYGILHGDLTLLGPRSSAADFYYGPIYYYFITPFLWLFQYDPVGPAIGIAVLGVVTVYLVYIVGKQLFDSKYAGLIAASLYAISPLVVAYSRSSWNPNPLPFVSLLALFLLYKAVAKSSFKLFLLVGILLGIGLQLQYLALFLGVIVAIFTFVGTWYIHKKFNVLLLLKRYFVVFAGFVIGFSPFLTFEAIHNFPNTRTIIRYIFTDELDPIDIEERPFFVTIFDVIFRLFARLVMRFPSPEQVTIGQNPYLLLWYGGTIVLIILSIFFVFKIKDRLAAILISTWLFLGVFLFTFYNDAIYDYHFGFMFTLPFLLTGNALIRLGSINKYKALPIIAYSIFWVILTTNLFGNPFQYPPNRQKDQVKQIAEFVLSKTDGKPFNFALITLGNSDHAYRYFMKVAGRDPVQIQYVEVDPQRKSITDQLLIVCEDPNCQPLGNSLWEVAGFGQAEIVDEWPVSVVRVVKLRHHEDL